MHKYKYMYIYVSIYIYMYMYQYTCKLLCAGPGLYGLGPGWSRAEQVLQRKYRVLITNKQLLIFVSGPPIFYQYPYFALGPCIFD